MIQYLVLLLAAVSAAAAVFVALKIKTVLYLLQQPVVKKMSPQLRLKPVKLDEVMDRNRNRGDRNGAPRAEGERREGGRDRRDGRPEGERREDRPRREGRPEGERREGRPEGERREGGRDRDRGPRPEGERREGGRENREPRAEGDRREGGRDRDRNREPRPEGERREGGRDRNREDRPRREFSETRDFAPAPQNDAPVASPESAPLSPRRPLFADAPAAESSAPAPARESSDNLFVGSSSDDLQHGRRQQLKKKPRFDIEEGSAEA